MAELKQLTTLDLRYNRDVTDAGLKEVANLKQLTSLDLTSTPVTDAGLKELTGLTRLATLELADTPGTLAVKELDRVKAAHLARPEQHKSNRRRAEGIGQA